MAADTCTKQTINRTASHGKCTSPTPTLGVRKLQIDGMGNSISWKYTTFIKDPNFEVAEIKEFTTLSIVGKIDVKSLSEKNTRYGAFLVFKLKSNSKGLEKAKASIRFLKDEVEGVDYDALSTPVFIAKKREHRNEFGQFARDLEDRWMEVKLGEFYYEDGEVGDVQIKLMSTTNDPKTGLFVGGIDVRPHIDVRPAAP